MSESTNEIKPLSLRLQQHVEALRAFRESLVKFRLDLFYDGVKTNDELFDTHRVHATASRLLREADVISSIFGGGGAGVREMRRYPPYSLHDLEELYEGCDGAVSVYERLKTVAQHIEQQGVEQARLDAHDNFVLKTRNLTEAHEAAKKAERKAFEAHKEAWEALCVEGERLVLVGRGLVTEPVEMAHQGL